MSHIDTLRSPAYDSYFLATLPTGESTPPPETKEAHEKLFAKPQRSMVELIHEAGAGPDMHYDSGNNEPKRGFGHLAFLTPDVYKASAELEAAGVAFKKKPDEGRMKGLAFALDPDGYWLEIVRRAEDAGFSKPFNLGQTMLRVKDPAKSLEFYRRLMGMAKICEKHFSDFSLYFLIAQPENGPLPDINSPDTLCFITRNVFMKRSWSPVLELTHNHGTENDTNFSYHNGCSEPKGFSHLTFCVDDVAEACAALEGAGARVVEACEEGGASACVADPDGYRVRLQRRSAAP
ncbi:unnamed protein product [Phaeothamnion confervicola]